MTQNRAATGSTDSASSASVTLSAKVVASLGGLTMETPRPGHSTALARTSPSQALFAAT